MKKDYTKYDIECITYLALQILKELEKEKEPIFIDLYYEDILKIYEHYKWHDNTNESVLDSINDFIRGHKDKILENIKESFVNAF